MVKLFFGIELELCVCEYDENKYENKKINKDTYSDKIEYIKNIFLNYLNEKNIPAKYNVFDDEKKNYFEWMVTTDDSIVCELDCNKNNGEKYHPVELVSPVLEYNESDIKLLKNVIYKIQEGFDFEINNTQGLHINISYEGQKEDTKFRRFDKILRFFESWWHYEEEILNILPIQRIKKLGFATPLTKNYTQGFEWFKNYLLSTEYFFDESLAWPSKYLAVNMRVDRFEIRLPPAYIKSSSIVFWIKLFVEFLRSCLDEIPLRGSLFEFIRDDGSLESIVDDQKNIKRSSNYSYGGYSSEFE